MESSSVGHVGSSERITGLAQNLNFQPDFHNAQTFFNLLHGVGQAAQGSSPVFTPDSHAQVEENFWENLQTGLQKAEKTLGEMRSPVERFAKREEPVSIGDVSEFTLHSLRLNVIETFLGGKAEKSGEEIAKLYQNR